MTKMAIGTQTDRFVEIARRGEMIFHARDLANLWGISDSNLLHTTLKRYVDRGLLYRIYKGLYALRPIDELDPELLGIKALHRYAYVSTETVLVSAGVMSQHIHYTTLVSNVSRKFTIGQHQYYVRQLADKYLFCSDGVVRESNSGVLRATIDRAVADLKYFNARVHLDMPDEIDWQRVTHMQETLGYPITIR